MPNFLFMLIGIAISLPISVALIAWMLHYKKERKFPKGALWILLAAGAAACVPPLIAGFLITGLGGGIPNMLMGGNAPAEAEQLPAHIMVASGAISAFLMAALLEEVTKFIGLTLASRRRDTVLNRFDAVLCGAIVGIGFQILEDALYVDPSGSMFTVVIRALTPFHFTFGAMMGWFWGKAKETGKKSNYVLAIFIPFLAHGLFDFAQELNVLNAFTFILFILSIIVMTVITIILMVKISKWSKSEKMLEPLHLYDKQ